MINFISIIFFNPNMNYFFTPFTLVNQYQPFYAYAHPLIIDASTYFI